MPKEEKERVIIEEEGKIYARVPEEEEEEVKEPEHEFTDEELAEEPEENEEEEPEKEEPEEEKEPEENEEEDKPSDQDQEIKEKYQGKSAEELVKMLDDRDKTIGKQGTELDKYRKLDPKEMSKDELKEKLNSTDLRQGLLTLKKQVRAARQKLDEMDSDIDGEEKVKAAEKELNELLDAQDLIEVDLAEKKTEEGINNKLTSETNLKFLKEKKSEFETKLGIPGEEFDKIVDASKGYIGNDGQISMDALGKGMIDLKNFEGVAKLYEISGNKKAREEIKDASTKVEKKVSTVTKGGKKTKLIHVTDDMSDRAVKSIVGNMSNDELFED